MTLTITEPGLVYDMSDETYHSDPVPGGSLSSTFARLLTEHVPAKAHAIRSNRKATKSMNLGKAAHQHALGVGPELVVYSHDGRTKAGKAEREEWAPKIATEAAVAVTEDERHQIHAMRDALLAHPEVQIIFATSQHEVSGFWQDDRDTWCRARYDLLNDLPWDYKTTEDVSPRGFQKAMATYGYHQQAEFYQRGLHAIGHPAGKRPMRFICQEKAEPYLVQIHTCDDLAIEVGRRLNDRAIRLYADCKTAGEWPGYPDLNAAPTGLPNHYFYRHEAVIPTELNPFSEVA